MMIKKLKDFITNWVLNYINYWVSQYGKDHEQAYILWKRDKYKVKKIRCDVDIEWGIHFDSSVSVLEIDMLNQYSIPDLSVFPDLKKLKIKGGHHPLFKLESLLKS